MTRKQVVFSLLIAVGMLLIPGRQASASHGAIGLIMDVNGRAVAFDWGTDTTVGSVSIGSAALDCVIDDDGLAYASTFYGGVRVVDLYTSPLALASGTNSIPTSMNNEDLSVTPDGSYVAVTDGGLASPVSTIQTASRSETSTFGFDFQSGEALGDGSLLTTAWYSGTLRRLTIGAGGAIADTGEVVGVPGAFNVTGTADGGYGLLTVWPSGEIRSFKVQGLGTIDSRVAPGGGGITTILSHDEKTIYVRTDSSISAWDFDPTTGLIGATSNFSVSVGPTVPYFGVDQIALSPDGKKLYVSRGPTVQVRDASTGASLGNVTGTTLSSAAGICFPLDFIPTKLVATPLVATVLPAAGANGSLRALLTRAGDGTPIAGQSVAFFSGTQFLCAAGTSSAGVAVCSDPDDLAAAVVNRGYRAVFAGHVTLGASADTASILSVNGTDVP